MLVPDNECFKGNVTSTYNVIEAACKLGVKKIIIASSETTYEVCFGQGDLDYTSFPLDEDADVNPMDTYAISKLCGERVARGFVRRFTDVDIYALRSVSPYNLYWPYLFETVACFSFLVQHKLTVLAGLET